MFDKLYINTIKTKWGFTMNKNGHAFGGLAICATSFYAIGFNPHSGESIINASLLIGSIMIGSFLPDLDADYSYLCLQGQE